MLKLKKFNQSSIVFLAVMLAICCLAGYNPNQASAGVPIGLTASIVQPAIGGQTKMASPLVVTTNMPAMCYYRVDADFVLATLLPEPQRTQDNAAGTVHTASLKDLTSGSHTVYVHCFNDGEQVVVSSTWTKLSPGTTKLLGVYGANSLPGTLWEINAENGQPTREIGPIVIQGEMIATVEILDEIGIPLRISAMAQDPTTGILYAATGSWESLYSDSLVTINPNTGVATYIDPICEPGDFVINLLRDGGCVGFNHQMSDISFNASGQLYGWSEEFGGNLYAINKNTGEATRVRSGEGSYETAGSGNGFDGNSFYLLPGNQSLVKVNKDTGLYEEGAEWQLDMAFDYDGCTFGAADFDSTGMFFAQAHNSVDGQGPMGTLVVIQKINESTAAVVDLNAGVFRAAVVDGIIADMYMMDAIAFYVPSPISYGTPELDTTPPGPLTNIKIVADAAGTVTITWTDPTDSDLYRIVIDETNDGTTTTNFVDKGVQTLILNGRQTGQEYTYTFRAEDTSGNLSSKQIYTITIPTEGQEEILPPAPPAPLITQDPEPGSPLPGSVQVGTLVKEINSSAVYFIDQDNRRHAFPDFNAYDSWFTNFDNVQIISAETLASIPLGTDVVVRPGTWLIKIQSDPKVYAIEPYGVIRWLTTEQIALDLYGLNWNNRIVDIDPAFFADYQIGSDVSTSTHPIGSVIQYASSSDIYYIENGIKRLIVPAVFSNDFFQDKFVLKNMAEAISYTLGDSFPELPIATLMTLR